MTQANKNFATNILHLVVNIIVGLTYTPYLVRSVGIVAYGVVPLVLVINQYINVLSMSLNNALTRFYSIEYRSNNFEKASKYFSTSIGLSVLLTITMFPLLYFGVDYIDTVFDISPKMLDSAKSLFRLTILSFFVSIINNCINTTLFADNYLDYLNYTKIARQSLKLIINILLFIAFDTDIIYIGYANLLSEIFVLLISIYFYKHTKPDKISYKPSYFQSSYFFSMTGMIFWVVIQRLGDTLIYKIDSIFMNIYFGLRLTGIIGAISEFGNYIISITAVLGSLCSPLLLIAFSKKEYADFEKRMIISAYLIGLLAALLCGLICGSAPQILSEWLGSEYAPFANWLILKVMVIPCLVEGGLYTNCYLYMKYNRIPALTTIGIGGLNVFAIFIILSNTHSIVLFLITCSIFMIIQGFVMNAYFFNKFYPNNGWIITLQIIKVFIFMLLVSALTFVLIFIFNYTNIWGLFFIYVVVSLLAVIIMDVFFLGTDQKKYLCEVIPQYRYIMNILSFKQH